MMAAEEKRQEAWRQVEKSDLTEGNMEVGVRFVCQSREVI